MVLVTVGLVVVQEMCARLGTFTGKGLAALIREEFKLRWPRSPCCLGCWPTSVWSFGVRRDRRRPGAVGRQPVHLHPDRRRPSGPWSCWFLPVRRAAVPGHDPDLFRLPVRHLPRPPGLGQVAERQGVPPSSHQKVRPAGRGPDRDHQHAYMQLYVAAAVADKGIGPEKYHYERVDTRVRGAIFSKSHQHGHHRGHGPRRSAISGANYDLGPGEAADALKPVAATLHVKLFALGLFGASALAGAIMPPLSTAYAVSEAVGVERSVSRRFTRGAAVPVAVHRSGVHRRHRCPGPRRPGQSCW